MLVKQYFGTGNFLSCSEIADNSVRRLFGVYDPRAVQQQLRVPALQRSVFPLVQSGVRFWPYLLVAHELRECSKTETERRLRRIRRLQRKESYSRDFGPLRFTTFRAYRAMHDKVIASATTDAGDLRSLACGRRRYRGKPSFFTTNASLWRKALRRSMGQNSQQFARLLTRLHKELPGSSVVDRAITELLKNPSYSSPLRRAAFCYAFLRCVYGISTSTEGIQPSVSNPEWAKLLSKLLQHPSTEFREYSKFKSLVEQSIEKPALGHIHRKAREDNARVLASLGFHVFYNLYVAHSPQGTAD